MSGAAVRLTQMLDEAVDRGRLRAGAAAVLTGAEETIAVIGTEPVGAETLFGIGSITKLLTAIATIRLADRHGLELDRPVMTVLDDFSFAEDEHWPRVTIRHLLSHSSGLPAGGRDWGPGGGDALARFADEDLAHYRFLASPGSFHCYSNTAFSLVGLVVEALSQMPFAAALKAEVLRPGNMEQSHYPPPAPSQRLSAPGHHGPNRTWLESPRLADNPAGYPSGFLLASLQDLVNLARALLDHSLLSTGQLRGLATEIVSRRLGGVGSPLAQASAGYGLGCYVGQWRSEPVLRHGGMQQSFNCSIDLFPRAGRAVVLLTNGCDDEVFTDVLTECYTMAIGPPLPLPVVDAPTGSPPTSALGRYIDVADGQQIEITELTRLVPLGGGQFLLGTVPLWFPSGSGPAPFLVAWGTPYLRWPESPGAYISAALAGTYEDTFYPDPSTDLIIDFDGHSWTVTVEDDAEPGAAAGPMALLSGHGLIELTLDAETLQLGRATHYRRKPSS